MTKSAENMVLRTVYLPKALDLTLRELAFRATKTKGELIRELIVEALGARAQGAGSKGSGPDPQVEVAASRRIARIKKASVKAGASMAKPRKSAASAG